ncbi:hypothetical protein HZC32_00780 [Candidatus Woesearchaeota archaeon]|nr:hypothetical protein [Candidatus Woesearchaeota archaeon]
MGFFSRLFGGREQMQEAALPSPELKDNKDLMWSRISEALSYIDNELRPELVRAQQKKWIRATFSDFRNFHLKIRDGRIRVEREAARLEAVPLTNPLFQEYSRNIVALTIKLSMELKLVEDQLQGERNINEITSHLSEGINIFDDLKSYWVSRVRKQSILTLVMLVIILTLVGYYSICSCTRKATRFFVSKRLHPAPKNAGFRFFVHNKVYKPSN